MLGKWRRRLRHLLNMVAVPLRKDVQRLRARSQDRALVRRSDLPLQRFSGRLLPSREVDLTSPWQYRLQLQRHLLAQGQKLDVECYALPATATNHSALAVPERSWLKFLESLGSDADLLMGVAPRRPRDFPQILLRRVSDWETFKEESALFLMRPAVTLGRTGEVRARYGFESGIVVEKWADEPNGNLAPLRWKPHSETFSRELRPTPRTDYADIPLLRGIAEPHLFEVTFPIDVVYTWVDGTDPEWIRRKRAVMDKGIERDLTEDAAADLRFADHDELRYSLRALERNAPWVRHIWLVTDRQRPAWLRDDHPRLTVVDHTDIAPSGTTLPTFNSHAIEANLHRIDGLSEHFLYLNDDVFISSPVEPDLFFSANGIANMFLSRALVGDGEPIPGEPASDTAGKNARALLYEVSDRRLTRKLFHAPFALNRRVSQEIENRWQDQITATRNAQFRQTSDVTVAGALHMNYAYVTGRAVSRSIRYRYINVGAKGVQKALAGLLRDLDVIQAFCLNEATHELPPAQIDSIVRDFLARAFPDASTFERELDGH